MKLSTRLTLGFSLLAVMPLALLVPLTLSELRASLSREYENRLQSATETAQTELARLDADVRRSMGALAESPAAEELARGLNAGGGTGGFFSAAVPLMHAERLTVLTLFDRAGRTLSSAQLPARVGDLDPRLFPLTATQGTPSWVDVELATPAGIELRPALVTARPVDYGTARFWAVGGIALDALEAEQLVRLTGAQVSIRRGGVCVARAGSVLSPTLMRSLKVTPNVTVELSFSVAALEAAERRVSVLGGVLGGIGVVLAVLLGSLVARVTTRPLGALAAGARRVAEGDWTHPVQARAGGEVGDLVVAFNAMTENLSRTTSKLVAAERVAAWQEMAKRLAHELKNPLTPIKMSLETLLAAHQQKSPKFATLFSEGAEAMLEEVERLRRTVDAFSGFARLPKPQLGQLEMTEWVTQVMGLHGNARATLDIRTELTPNLPIVGDRDQLTQVLVNLLKNAEEAMHGKGTLWVRTCRVQRDAVLEVEDSGPGIPAAVREQLFTPYFTTKAGGTGLGLAISARIANEHAGRLEVESPAGRGALFRLVVPLRNDDPTV